MKAMPKWTARRGGMKSLAALAGALACLAPSARAESFLDSFLHAHYTDTLALIPVVTLLVLLAFIVHVDRYITPDNKKRMQVIIIVVFSLVAQNYIEYRAAAGDLPLLARTLASIYGYAIRPVILILFFRIIAPQRRFGWAWTLAGVNAAVNATALFSHICFWIDARNLFHRGPLSGMCLYVSAILLAYWLALTIRTFQPHRRRETWVPVLALALIIGGIVLDGHVGMIAQPVTFLTSAVVIDCVAYYIWLHLQFVWEHEQALMAGQRMQLTLSQIKPHFLHNALTVIIDLCDTDPQKAKQATVAFSKYLRGNMDSIEQTGPIPFTQELEHTKLYLDIEKLRFQDDLRVEYDIACTDFRLPGLTVEPLAENAVRHGVREKPDGRGTVTIATRETPEGYEVWVTDDGPGFDPSRPPEDGARHMGIANVRERLEQISGGTLEYVSGAGGTTAILRIPREGGSDGC